MKCVEYKTYSTDKLYCGLTGGQCTEQNCPRGRGYYIKVMKADDSSLIGRAVESDEEKGE